MMLTVFTCRCFIQWLFPFYLNISYGATILSVVAFFSSMCCAVYSIYKSYRVNCKFLITLFVIYSLYIYYYLFISPKIQLSQMAHVPENSIDFIKSSVLILFVMLSSTLCARSLDCKKYAIITIFILLLFFFIYFSHIDFVLYKIIAEYDRAEREATIPRGYLDGFTIGNYMGLLFACNLFMWNKWTKNMKINLSISIAIGIVCFVIQFLVFKRGPIIFMISTFFFYLFARGVFSKKTIGLICIVLLVLSIGGDYILSLLSSISSSTIMRFTTILSDGGSGRFGSSDSEYVLAIKQILQDPIFGTYPRTLSVSRLGRYPHNIILELLMTFGLFFTIPIVILLWKAVKQSYFIIKNGGNETIFAIWFIYILSCRMTSGSIICDTNFWFCFAVVLCIDKTSINNPYFQRKRYISKRIKLLISHL